MLQLARLLAGLHKPCSGSMVYGEEVMEYFTPQGAGAVIAAYALRLYSAIFSCWSSALCWIISA